MLKAVIVDDSRALRMILARIIRELGYEVGEAGNGREALNVIGNDVNLILTDWNMPEMNGLELVKQLRQNPALSSVPIVMVTTETEVPQMAAALEAGANEYVMKPFTKDILIEKLQLMGIHA